MHHNFSMLSLVSVIQHAGQKRIAQGPVGNKLTTNQPEFTGRPSSTQSVIPGNPAMHIIIIFSRI